MSKILVLIITLLLAAIAIVFIGEYRIANMPETQKAEYYLALEQKKLEREQQRAATHELHAQWAEKSFSEIETGEQRSVWFIMNATPILLGITVVGVFISIGFRIVGAHGRASRRY